MVDDVAVGASGLGDPGVVWAEKFDSDRRVWGSGEVDAAIFYT